MPSPKVFGQDADMASLLSKIDQLQLHVEADTIDRLEEENNLLRQSITVAHEGLYHVGALLKEVFESVVLLEVAIFDYQKARERSTAEWVLQLRDM